MVDVQRLTTNWEAVQLTPTHSGTDTFLDEVGFQLSNGANDGQEQPAHCTIRGDILSPRDELDAERVQFINDTQKCFVERASLSNAATMTTSNFRFRASRSMASRPGRRALLPETPTSMYSQATSKPRCCANRRRSYN
jgi:hypothetical protein